MKALRRARSRTELAEYVEGIEVVEIGGVKVAARACNHTVSAVAHEYSTVSWELEQIRNIASQRRDLGKAYLLEDIKRDFTGQRVLTFASDSDLREAAEPEGHSAASRASRSVSFLAASMIARPIGRTPETVLQYVKVFRMRQKKKRRVRPFKR